MAALELLAVQLLMDRIRAADGRFPLGAPASPLLRQLCARLDGLLLALEMAGAIVPLLGLQGVLAALDQRFSALKRGHRDAPPRHRTLRAAMAWSHRLLLPAQQRAFRRLGVLASGLSLDPAGAARCSGREGVDPPLGQRLGRQMVPSVPPKWPACQPRARIALRACTNPNA